MIGRGQVETQHPEDRRQDAFSLPQGQVDDEPARQRGFDGEIGILPLPATRAAADVKRLRQLEQENGRLKKMVADRDLEIDVLKEITQKKMGFLSRIGAKWSVLAASDTLFLNRLRALLSTLYRTGDSTLKRPGRL